MPYVTNRTKTAVDDSTPERYKALNKVWWLLNRDMGGTQELEVHMGEFPAGASHPLHRHENSAEILFVVEGHGLHKTEDGEIPIGPGDLTMTPAGEWHGLSNAGEEPLIVLAVNEGISHWDDVHYESHPSVGVGSAEG